MSMFSNKNIEGEDPEEEQKEETPQPVRITDNKNENMNIDQDGEVIKATDFSKFNTIKIISPPSQGKYYKYLIIFRSATK